jgi:alpha-1,3-glucosyltransferase
MSEYTVLHTILDRGQSHLCLCFRSDSSEIYAPRPIRALHAETRRWLGTSEMGSPASSRAVSPDSEVVVFPTGSKFRSASSASTSSSRRVHRSMSFSSLKENGQGQVPASPTKRRSSRLTGIGEDVGGDPTRSTTSRSEGSTEVGMARRWVKWMHAQGLRDWVVLTSVSASILVKWTIGLGSYSGKFCFTASPTM